MTELILSTSAGQTARCELESGIYTIGRDPENSIVVEDPSVSNHHCEIEVREDGEIWVKDLGSSNGLTVNGELVTEAVLPRDAKVGLGSVLLTVGRPEPIAAPMPAALSPKVDSNAARSRSGFFAELPRALAFPLRPEVLFLILGVALLGNLSSFLPGPLQLAGLLLGFLAGFYLIPEFCTELNTPSDKALIAGPSVQKMFCTEYPIGLCRRNLGFHISQRNSVFTRWSQRKWCKIQVITTLQAVVQGALEGQEGFASPSLGQFQWEEIKDSVTDYFILVLVCFFLPGLVSCISDCPGWAVSAATAAGSIYFSIAFLYLVVTGTLGGLNPLLVTTLIARTPVAYAIISMVLYAAFALEAGPASVWPTPESNLVLHLGIGFLISACSLYLLFVWARLLGIFYRCYQNRLAWYD